MRLHWHRDPDWEIRNVHRYEQCWCGARRTSRAYSNLDGPIEGGWPDTIDRHGVERFTSGWMREPVTGWPEPEEFRPPPPIDWPRMPPPPPPYRPGGLIR
jgi:hypothetical protein